MISIDSIPNIISWLKSTAPLPVTTIKNLVDCFTELSVPKKHRLISEGKFTGYGYFIEKGMTRSYWMVNGQEITTSFSTEGHLVFSMDEMYYNKLSEEYVETIEQSIVYRITISELLTLIHTDANLALWWAKIHQEEYRRLHRSHKEQLTLDAADRYAHFFEQFPDVCRRARLIDIASYLGITPSTLSRIRAERN